MENSSHRHWKTSFLSYRLTKWNISGKDLEAGNKILTPVELKCCKSKFRLDPRAANVRIYGVNGIFYTFCYHGRCKVCKKTFYYNFTEDEFHFRQFNKLCEQKYFIISSGIVFTIEYLNQVSLDITIGNVSFEKLAEIYNCRFNLFGTVERLCKDSLENNWLIYRLLLECGSIQWYRKEDSHFFVKKYA